MEQVNQAELDRIAAVMCEEQVGEMTAWMYVKCRLLAAQGLLEFKGMSTACGHPDYFVYSDPRTHDLYAVQRPYIGQDAERMLVDRMVSLARSLPN